MGEHFPISSLTHHAGPCPFNTVDKDSQMGSNYLYWLTWEPSIREYVDGPKYSKDDLGHSFVIFSFPSHCPY